MPAFKEVPFFVKAGIVGFILLGVILTLIVHTDPIPEGGQPAAIAESLND